MLLSVPDHPAARWNRGGFSLIVTVTILVLLSLVAVGLLTLSTITVRSSTAGDYQAQARANARLALMLAIGEIQKQAGADTRVTAPAAILDEDHPPLTGVWRSWEGTDHRIDRRFGGQPIAPDYDAKTKDESEDGRFLAWLASSPGRNRGVDSINGRIRAEPFDRSVPLLSTGTLAADDEREVHARPVLLESDRGAIAWWAAGENQKALVPRPYEPDDDTAGRWSMLAKSHSVADPATFRLDPLLDDPSPAAKAITLDTATFLAAAGADRTPPEFFHDLSAHAVGLLTNTATGGWRKDLSLFTENWDRLPDRNLPLFRITPDRASSVAKPSPRNFLAPQSMLYPWANYRGGNPPIYQHGATASWHHLKDWATFPDRVRAAANGRVTIPYKATDIVGNNFNFLHEVRTVPVIARVHWVFSHRTERRSRPAGRNTHDLQLIVNPVVTMWNPYNTALNCVPMSMRIPKPLPCAFQYQVGRSDRRYRALTNGVTNHQPPLAGWGNFNYSIRRGFILAPGETRIFSPQSPRPAESSHADLAPGYRSTAGHLIKVRDAGNQPLTITASDVIKVNVRFDTTYNDRSHGVGIYLDAGKISGGRDLAYRMVFEANVANAVYPPITAREFTQPTAAEVENNPQPFLSTVFGTRLASDSHLPAKGFVQSSPLVNYTAMGSKSMAETNIAREYPGVMHPVNSPFDYSFLVHAPGDSRLPNEDSETSRGYIVSGFDKSTGLSRVVTCELPLRPLTSLAELQNWDLRYENPIPPFAYNLIGNSAASPLFPPNAVVNAAERNLPTNLQHDDSFCANHVLFDDWFCSSIAPDPVHFGRGAPLRTTFTSFLSGENPLPNRAYRPILEDQGLDEDTINNRFREEINDRDSWQTIASRLEVEGMFNVNSTSVAAWRALLGHARNQKVPYIVESGNSWEVDLSPPVDHPVSRFPVAGDVQAGQPGSSGAFPDSSEFSGYRLFEESTLDRLAEEIVKQVRLRGPFLSLAEFVNRQLSSGDLALAGAVQAALDELARSASDNPYSVLQSLSRDTEPGNLGQARVARYAFPEAAEGESAFGLPGWTRQADVLRPLAPILSARDDTFTIRAYGDARDVSGEIRARATCEAVIRRTRDFLDPEDDADRTGPPAVAINRLFGRRFVLVSFRWLSPDEV